MIERVTVISCERCYVVERHVGTPDFEAAWAAAKADGWCEDEDGAEVCPACWKTFDAAQSTRETPP